MKTGEGISRRHALKVLGVGLLLPQSLACAPTEKVASTTRVFAHIWPYASQFPPDWDATPVLDQVFSDFRYAGIDGVEVMDSVLRNPSGVEGLQRCRDAYGLPVVGASYYADMWDKTRHSDILEDARTVIGRLAKLGGTLLGITVGDASRQKTEQELDDQAELLVRIMELCKQEDVLATLHNHTFEMAYGKVDFLGTLQRVPELKLGPDINWLLRSGIDPVAFLREYGEKIVFLHLRDQAESGEWTNPLGSGSTDFQAIAAELRNQGFSGDMAIELAYEGNLPGDIRGDLKASRTYVKRVFGW